MTQAKHKNENSAPVTLGEVIRRSFTLHLLDGSTSVIRMFAGSLLVANPGDEPLKTLLLKEECDPDCVQTVWVNQTPADFRVDGGYLQLRLTTPPGETDTVCVSYRGDLDAIPGGDSLRTNLKVAARRYLSEFRDNYISRNDFVYQSARRLKHLFLSGRRK